MMDVHPFSFIACRLFTCLVKLDLLDPSWKLYKVSAWFDHSMSRRSACSAKPLYCRLLPRLLGQPGLPSSSQNAPS